MAGAAAQVPLALLLGEAREDLVRTNTDFDRDTSGRYAPELQHQWLERVERELTETATR